MREVFLIYITSAAVASNSNSWRRIKTGLKQAVILSVSHVRRLSLFSRD